MNLVRKMLAKLGLLKLVWLKDKDGELTLAIKRDHPFGGFMAYRFWIIGKTVRLEDDGSCSGLCYVRRWRDYK